jgi:AraC-like DNA-binding protein
LISRSAQASTELRSADGAPIGASWQAQNLETIQLLRIESETDYLKGPARDEDAFYQFILPIQGRVRVAQDSRTAVIGPGHLAVLDTTRSFEVRFDGRVAVVAVGMPQQHIGIPPALMQQIIAADIGSGTDGDVISIVLPMLVRLADGLIGFSSYSPARLAQNLTDLLKTVLLEHLSSGSPPGSVKRFILEIISFIDANLDDPELSGETIAAAHFISPRYLRKLFEGQQVKVSEWVRIRRLESCRRDLVDPMLDGRPISTIAARWGFPDPAHFSRLFKATYGHSPSQLRRNGFASADEHELPASGVS